MRHVRVSILIVEQINEGSVYRFFGCADKFERASGDAFRPFGRVAHDEYRFSERGGLFLDTAGISEHKVTAGEEVVEIYNFKWVNDAKPIASG